MEVPFKELKPGDRFQLYRRNTGELLTGKALYDYHPHSYIRAAQATGEWYEVIPSNDPTKIYFAYERLNSGRIDRTGNISRIRFEQLDEEVCVVLL